MKFFLIAFGLLFLTTTASAASFESVFLSEDVNDCVDSMQLKHSPLTERIAEDKLLGASYFVNPFLNIDRSIRLLNEKPACLGKYMQFRNKALIMLNSFGKIGVYGPREVMGYFTGQKPFFYAGE